ncbi:hypothetical protein Mapa_015680 [Marchantia paleacea]|nr:hypothetical protein Mapa_015680 [Marchantia paleacea]
MCRILKFGRFFLSVSGSPDSRVSRTFDVFSVLVLIQVRSACVGRMGECGSVDIKNKVRRPRKVSSLMDFSAKFACIQQDKTAK